MITERVARDRRRDCFLCRYVGRDSSGGRVSFQRSRPGWGIGSASARHLLPLLSVLSSALFLLIYSHGWQERKVAVKKSGMGRRRDGLGGWEGNRWGECVEGEEERGQKLGRVGGEREGD